MRLEGQISAETTFFTTPQHVVNANLLSRYISSLPNGKDQNRALVDLGKIARNPDKREELFKHAFLLYADAHTKSGTRSERTQAYRRLLEGFNSKYVLPHIIGEEYDDINFKLRKARTEGMYSLERSSYKVTEQALNITNECLQQSFPDEFGTVIP